jgi:hypothetical protein
VGEILVTLAQVLLGSTTAPITSLANNRLAASAILIGVSEMLAAAKLPGSIRVLACSVRRLAEQSFPAGRSGRCP